MHPCHLHHAAFSEGSGAGQEELEIKKKMVERFTAGTFEPEFFRGALHFF